MYSMPKHQARISYIVLSPEGLLLNTGQSQSHQGEVYGGVGALPAGVRGGAPRIAPVDREDAKLATDKYHDLSCSDSFPTDQL